MNGCFNGWLACFAVQQQQEEEEQAECCQIVCADVSTVELDQNQLWEFSAEDHPGLAMLTMQGYSISLYGVHIKVPVSNELSACYITAYNMHDLCTILYVTQLLQEYVPVSLHQCQAKELTAGFLHKSMMYLLLHSFSQLCIIKSSAMCAFACSLRLVVRCFLKWSVK